METSSSDDDVDAKLTHLFKTTKRKPSIALLDDKNRVKYCLNTHAKEFHSHSDDYSMKNDDDSHSNNYPIPYLVFFFGCFPILNWKWYVPPRWLHLIKEESRLNGVSSDGESFDYYPVSKEARTFHDLRSFCCFTIFSIYACALTMFFWSRVLVIEPYTPNQLYCFFLSFCFILFLNAYFVKKELYSFQRGMHVSTLLCTLLLSSFILVTGGNKSPVFISLFGLISLFSSFAGQSAGNCLGAYVLLFDVFLLLYPEYSISLVDENFQLMVTMQENFISIAVTLLVVHWNFSKSKSEKTVLENCVIHSLNADKSKSFFLASTAHEMRTPLHHINLVNMMLVERISSFMAESSSDPMTEKHEKEVLGLVKQGNIAAQLLLTLIDDALDLSQMEVGELPLKIEPININQPVSNTYKMFQQIAKDKNIQFIFDNRTSETNTMCADKTRLVQILSNLLGNAFKFTPDGGSVKLIIERKSIETYSRGCKDNGDRICISIEDNGIGIPSKDMKSIFFPFSQVDGQSTTRKYRGGGLGLAITRKLAKLLNANLTVQSQEGVGSVFSVWFQPLSEDQASTSDEDSSLDNASEGKQNDAEIGIRQLSNRHRYHRGSLSIKNFSNFTSDVTKSMVATSVTENHNNNNNDNTNNNNDSNINSNAHGKNNNEKMTATISSRKSNNNDDNSNNNNKNEPNEKSKSTLEKITKDDNTDITHTINNNEKHTTTNDSILEESRVETITSKLIHGTKGKEYEHNEFQNTGTRKKGKRKRVKSSNKVLDGCNIIICDDNVVSLKLLSVMLRNLGCQVTAFEHPRDLLTTFKQSLLNKLKRKRNEEQKSNHACNTIKRSEDLDAEDLEFDFLLLDLYMPELDGFDVAKAIRQMEQEYRQWESTPSSSIPSCPSSSLDSLFSLPLPLGSSEKVEWSTSKHKDTYIMALSATSKVDDRNKALQECQMDFFMNKPFEMSNLTGVLSDVKKQRDRIKILIGEE